MNSDIFEGHPQEPPAYIHLQHLQEEHRDELEGIVQVLANITHVSPEKIKPYMNKLLQQLVDKQGERPFHETANTEEWVAAFQTWAANHHHNAPPLSDYAVSRESMYKDEQL